MKTLTTTTLILLIPFVYCYSLPADSSPTSTPFATATPYHAASSTATPSNATSPTQSHLGDVAARMRELDARMDTIFGNAFRNAGEWFNHSTLASSVDLREQNDKYIARVYLPHFDTSKAQVKVENGTLHIVANAENTANNAEAQTYEQTLSLPKPVQSNDFQVQRKPDLLVITVPKQTARSGVASSTATPSPGSSSESAANEYDWENSIASEFAQMNEAMDRALHESFPDTFDIGANDSQLESAVKMDDQKDKYVVHFYMPERNVSDVHVDYDNGQLHLTAKEGGSATPNPGDDSSIKVTGEYRASISVPGPVNENEMKIDRQANAVVVTLPKA